MKYFKYHFKSYNIFLILSLLIINTCCSRHSEKKYLKKNINNLLGKVIYFPDTLTILNNYCMVKISSSSVKGEKYTIIKRVTADCPKCINNMKLFQEEIVNKLDTCIVKPVFIIYTSSFSQFKGKIYPEIKEIYPLVVDTLNKFTLSNDLPLFDERFHTFLLDSQNRILIIGDPTNQKIGKLYRRFELFNDL